MSSQTIVISNLGDILIAQGFEVSNTLLKMWLFFKMVSTTLELISMLLFFIKYRMPIIFK